MSTRSIPAPLRAALALSLISLLSLGSCDLAGSEGGPGVAPPLEGVIPTGPLPTPFALTNLRANPGTSAVESNNYSQRPSISSDGRYVAFHSFATNLVAGVTDGKNHVYVRDMQTQITSLVTRNNAGSAANSDSQDAFISDDGRYVVFSTIATNLDSITVDNNNAWDIYLRDRVGDDGFFEEDINDTDDATTIRVSLVNGTNAQATGHSFRPTISNDGTRIAFQSDATNLIGLADTNNTTDVYVRILPSTTTRVSVANGTGAQANSSSFNPSISGNGGHVSFMSIASNLVPNDTFGYYDIFRATVTGAPVVDRVSLGIGGAQPSDYCYTNYFQGGGRGISADGSRVAFASPASNLVSNDFNGQFDVFVRDFAAGPLVMTRIVGSQDQEGNGFTFDGRLSADGTRVAFLSNSSNFGPDFNFNQDVFVKDLDTNEMTLVSNSPFGSSSDGPVLSSDGTVAAFSSYGPDFVDNDTNSQQDIFVHALENGQFPQGTILRASLPTAASEADDGSFKAFVAAGGPVVVFETAATNMVPNDNNSSRDIFISDPIGQTVRLVSKNSAGTHGTGDSQNPVCSSDGRFVAFESTADNLLLDVDGDGSFDDTNSVRDIFVHDVVTSVTTRVSVATDGTEADADCFNPSMSSDGRFVAFESTSGTLDPAVAFGGISQIFVHDRLTKTTVCVSIESGGTGVEGDSDSFDPSISSNGQVVAFSSLATNLDPAAASGTQQVFVRDMAANSTSCVSVAGGFEGDSLSFNPSLSANGLQVAFNSLASNLDPVADGSFFQIFVHNRQGAGSTNCVSVAGGVAGNANSFNPFISADGRFIAFDSMAINLHPAATSGSSQVFMRNRISNSIACISINDLGIAGNGDNHSATVTGDGRWAAFLSSATNLVVPDNGAFEDVFLRGPIDADAFIAD
jgi:hypothetical protein